MTNNRPKGKRVFRDEDLKRLKIDSEAWVSTYWNHRKIQALLHRLECAEELIKASSDGSLAKIINAKEVWLQASGKNGGGFVNSFNQKSRCPKCGCSDVLVRYVGDTERDPCWYDRDRAGFPRGEYLRRTCTRCEFRWAESVIEETEVEK